VVRTAGGALVGDLAEGLLGEHWWVSLLGEGSRWAGEYWWGSLLKH
jgi:hypothetical protein